MVVNLLELIQVDVIMKIMKLVEYKHLLVSLKTDNQKIKQKIKRTSIKNRLSKKYCQITKNEKHAIKNKSDENWKKN